MAWRQKEKGWRELSLSKYSLPLPDTVWKPVTPQCSGLSPHIAPWPDSSWKQEQQLHAVSDKMGQLHTREGRAIVKTDVPWACFKLQHYYFHYVQRSMQNFKQLTWKFFAVCRILVLLLLSKLMKADFQAKVHYKRQPSLSWKKPWHLHQERNWQLNKKG